MPNGILTGVVIGVVGTWAFHRYVKPLKGKS